MKAMPACRHCAELPGAGAQGNGSTGQQYEQNNFGSE